jgi:hypothetical protein
VIRDGRDQPPHRRAGFSIREAMLERDQVDRVERLLDRAFATDLDSRFQTYDEFSHQLDALLLLPEIDEDPSIVAAELARDRRKRDRRSRLAEYARRAKELVRHVIDARANIGAVEGFSLHFSPWSQTFKLPETFAALSDAFQLRVVLDDYKFASVAVFVVAAQHESIVMLRQFAARNVEDGGAQTLTKNWELIDRCGNESELNLDWINKSVKKTVVETIRELDSKIPIA